MTKHIEKQDQGPASQPSQKPNWKGWLGIALFIAFIVGVNIEKNSKEDQGRSATAWRGSAQQIGEEVCDAYQWSQKPDVCEELAKEARARAERRFDAYQK